MIGIGVQTPGRSCAAKPVRFPSSRDASRLLKWKIALLALACIVCGDIARGGSGQVIEFPRAGVRNRCGLRLSVDTQWVDASGYRDVRIALSTVRNMPSPRDRQLRIEISPNSYGPGNREIITRGFIELPQGSTSVTSHLLVPQSQPWHQVRVDVYEGGSEWEELSGRVSMTNSVGDQWSEAVPTVLVIDAAAPSPRVRSDRLARFNRNRNAIPVTKQLCDIRGLESLVNRGMFHPGSAPEDPPRDMELLRRISSTPRLEMLPPQELSEKWQALTCCDFVFISLDDLATMGERHRGQFQAVVAWVAGGGNLLVFDAGDDYARLPDLETLLQVSPKTDGKSFADAGWQPPQDRDFNDRPVQTFQQMQQYGSWYPQTTDDREEPQPVPDPGTVAGAFGGGSGPKFLMRRLGMGTVIAMSAEDPFPGSTTEWSWVLNAVGQHRSMWYRRHGLSLRRENDDYWDFLIPDTGKAPVAAFCVLITLFAVVIGPANYFLLLRKRRLYMLLATIPIGAALVTVGLFGYALLTDGLGTRVRVRSYTHLDQRAGRAVNWSRQSYYAGLAPSRGLTFPEDTAVYVFEQFPRNQHDGSWHRQRTLVWDQGQNLRTGYVTSRVTSQFLAIRSTDSAAGVRLDKDKAPTQAHNGLGTAIRQILVRDRAGDYYWAENVDPDQSFALAAADFSDCHEKIKKGIYDNRPQPPEGFEADQFDGWFGRGFYTWGIIDNGLAPPRTSSSLMERRIRRLRNANKQTLKPGGYIALVEAAPEVPLGLEGARQVGSFHLVQGEF